MRAIQQIIYITVITGLFVISAASQTSIKPGYAAPVFAASALDGSYFDLAQLDDKVVVLTFWSTKCAICRSEIPKLNGFTTRYDSEKVVFLALTMENESRLDPFLKANPFKFHILPNSFGVVLQYADRDKAGNIDMGFPAYFVIDKHGSVAYRGSGWAKTNELEARISKLIANN